jgi:hypothetical protein
MWSCGHVAMLPCCHVALLPCCHVVKLQCRYLGLSACLPCLQYPGKLFCNPVISSLRHAACNLTYREVSCHAEIQYSHAEGRQEPYTDLDFQSLQRAAMQLCSHTVMWQHINAARKSYNHTICTCKILTLRKIRDSHMGLI